MCRDCHYESAAASDFQHGWWRAEPDSGRRRYQLHQRHFHRRLRSYDASNSKSALTGFNFVVSGFVQGTGRIVWFKKVVDRNTSDVLFSASGVFLGGAYAGGSNGAFSVNTFIPLSRPSSNFTVFETFLLDIAGAGAPGIDTAALLDVEQDWVPEPASLIALATGLGALALRRRKK